jgi:hypothetical protein
LGSLVVVASAAAIIEGLRVGRASAAAVAIAAGMCAGGGLMALIVISRLRGPQRALLAIVAGALLRGVAPLSAGLALRAGTPWLAEAGIEKWVLGFYLFTLMVEVFLLPGLLAEKA